ncbi:hypothetical protein RhiirC2_801967, partial [Rhizophagus irregularis]
HNTAKQTIKGCNRIVTFFKWSHIVGKLLADAAATLRIEGGELKTYSETRWISMYETANSVSCLRIALEHMLINNPNEITKQIS